MPVTAVLALIAMLQAEKTPEATVRGFVESLNMGKWEIAFSKIEGAKVEAAVKALAKMPTPQLDLEIFKLELVTTGDDSKGTLDVRPKGGGSMGAEDEITLHRTNGEWKIVSGRNEGGLVNQVVMIGKDPSILSQPRAAVGKTVILSNLKQIALGAMILASDNKDVLAFNQANMKKKLDPYLKNNTIWQDSEKRPLDVQFNANLAGVSIMKVKAPAETVLFTIGKKGALQYFGGTTPVAFVDGHAKFLTKEAVAKLRWK